MRFSSMELLPQSPNTQLPTHLTFSRILKMLEFSTFHTIEALENFYVKKNYHAFDPHVGDTACQIHAYKIFLLSLEPITSNLSKKISQLKTINEKIKNDLIYYTKIENTPKARHLPHTTLEAFINDQHYDYELEDDEIFIVISRILTIYKKFISDGKFIIDYEKISRDLNISRESATKLAIFYQRKISRRSCNLILNIATQIPDPFIGQEILRSVIVKDDNAREGLPCYISMKIILAHMRFLNIGLTLIIKRAPNNKVIDRIIINYGHPPPQQAEYIIEGTSTSNENKEAFLERFLQYNIDEIILLNEAIHPQFSGKKLEHLKDNPFMLLSKSFPENLYKPLEDEFLTLQKRAAAEGFDLKNSILFCIDHIFCGKMPKSFGIRPELTTMTEQQEDLLLMD